MGLIAKWNTDTLLSMKLYLNVIVDKMRLRGCNVIVTRFNNVGWCFENIGNP